jgi:hypothetical protein
MQSSAVSFVVFTDARACTVRCDVAGATITRSCPSAVRYCEDATGEGRYEPVGGRVVGPLSTTTRGATFPIFDYAAGGFPPANSQHSVSDIDAHWVAVWQYAVVECFKWLEAEKVNYSGIQGWVVVAPATAKADDLVRMRSIALRVFAESPLDVPVHVIRTRDLLLGSRPSRTLNVSLCHASAVAVEGFGYPAEHSSRGMLAVEDAFCRELDRDAYGGTTWGTALKSSTGKDVPWNQLREAIDRHCMPRASPDDDMDGEVEDGIYFSHHDYQITLSGRVRNCPFEDVLFSGSPAGGSGSQVNHEGADADADAGGRSMLDLVCKVLAIRASDTVIPTMQTMRAMRTIQTVSRCW